MLRTTRRHPALLLLAALVGCAPGAIGFDIDRPLPERTLPGDPALNALGVQSMGASMGGASLPIDLSTEVPAQGSPGISRVLLSSLSFSITKTAEPADDDDCFDFVRTVSVWIESTMQGTTLPRVRIADASNPGCVRTMAFVPVPEVDLKPYADEGFRVVPEAMGIPPADDVSFQGRIVLRAAILS